jgi:hypothetical protein
MYCNLLSFLTQIQKPQYPTPLQIATRNSQSTKNELFNSPWNKSHQSLMVQKITLVYQFQLHAHTDNRLIETRPFPPFHEHHPDQIGRRSGGITRNESDVKTKDQQDCMCLHFYREPSLPKHTRVEPRRETRPLGGRFLLWLGVFVYRKGSTSNNILCVELRRDFVHKTFLGFSGVTKIHPLD